jgi:DNA-binding transcriptional MerR regulator
MAVNKSKAAFRTIAELAGELEVGTHVLRFWETKFPQIKPMKRSGGRRYYRPDDVELLGKIKDLLYTKRFTIEGVQKLFNEKGVKAFLGDKIQDDFFADASAEDDIFNELLPEIVKELKSIKEHLADVLK